MQGSCHNIYKQEFIVVSCAQHDEEKQFLKFLANKVVSYQYFQLKEFQNIGVDKTDKPTIFIVGDDQAKKISIEKELASGIPFSLVVSFDSHFFDHPDAFICGRQYLMHPFSDGDIENQLLHINKAFDINKDTDMLLESNIVGKSNALKNMHEIIASIARYDTPTLLKGETGTGKELVARSLHYQSLRCDGPFIPVNCGALTDTLLLAELFGYEKGAFTDAKKSHAGYVQQANKGTLFLDEVDSLSLKAQAALLRFIQENEYRRLGGEQLLLANVRIICATNQKLMERVSLGLFREDLFYRLDVLNIEIPPLRSRGGDIVILAKYFLRQFAHEHNEPLKYLHPRTLSWMERYEWPGNVRELENYIYRTVILSQGQVITIPDVKGDPIRICGGAPVQAEAEPSTFQEAKAVVVQRFEKNFLQDVMKKTEGNISEAARRAGTERRVLGRLLKKYGIERSHYCQ